MTRWGEVEDTSSESASDERRSCFIYAYFFLWSGKQTDTSARILIIGSHVLCENKVIETRKLFALFWKNLEAHWVSLFCLFSVKTVQNSENSELPLPNRENRAKERTQFFPGLTHLVIHVHTSSLAVFFWLGSSQASARSNTCLDAMEGNAAWIVEYSSPWGGFRARWLQIPAPTSPVSCFHFLPLTQLVLFATPLSKPEAISFQSRSLLLPV